MAGDDTPPYGKRLLPNLLDSLALAEPDRIIYSIASFSDDSAQFRGITASAFAKAVDKTAWWLHNQIKSPNGTRNGDNGELKQSITPIGYIGPRKSRRFPPEDDFLLTDLIN
jgi:hypothetical protein